MKARGGAMQNRKSTKAKDNLSPRAKRQVAITTTPTATPEPELIYAAKLQRKLGISDVTLWRWRHDERVGFPKGRLINRRVYFPWQEVAEWLNRQQQVA
jgi:predicted DNA-binding transcriptional regulator AlpA